jgi:hypothetical protein
MATVKQCWDLLAKYPEVGVEGKLIDAGLLLAWLSIEHNHHDNDADCASWSHPYVNSMELDSFIRENAI